MIEKKSLYTGKLKSRKQLAAAYGISCTQFNRLLKGIKELESLNHSKRSLLYPKEINILINIWGDFRETDNEH